MTDPLTYPCPFEEPPLGGDHSIPPCPFEADNRDELKQHLLYDHSHEELAVYLVGQTW